MIAFKNIFLKKCIIFFFLIIFLNFFPNKVVVAHELWLEKNSNLEDKTLIDIMIGQNFKGTPFGFSNNEKEKLFLDNNNIIKDIEQRDGDFPAIQMKLNNNNFNIINYEVLSTKLLVAQFVISSVGVLLIKLYKNIYKDNLVNA